MSEPDPFVKKNPGDIILASDWNQMQVLAQKAIDKAIVGHTHTGDALGPKLTGAGIDAAAELSVKSLTTTGPVKAGNVALGTWPSNAGFAFFGAGTLDHSNQEQYALLQGTTGGDQGRTFLNSPLDIRFRLKNADKMTLSADGNLGIGTTAQGAKLEVGGDVKVNGKVAVSTASDIRGNDVLNLLRFGTTGDYQILHKKAGVFGRNMLGIHCHQDDSFGVYSSSWTPLLEIAGGTGDTYFRGNVGVGVKFPTISMDVAGTVRAQAYATQLYTATGTTNINFSSANTWADVPDLSLTVNVTATTNALICSNISALGGDSPLHLVLRITVDGTVVAKHIVGNVFYWGAFFSKIMTLSQGQHSIKVQYRTPQTKANNDPNQDWEERSLQVLVFGV